MAPIPNIQDLSEMLAKQSASNQEMAGVMNGKNKIVELENAMIEAENRVRNSPTELKLAQEAYYKELGGLSKYQDFKGGDGL